MGIFGSKTRRWRDQSFESENGVRWNEDQGEREGPPCNRSSRAIDHYKKSESVRLRLPTRFLHRVSSARFESSRATRYHCVSSSLGRGLASPMAGKARVDNGSWRHVNWRHKQLKHATGSTAT